MNLLQFIAVSQNFRNQPSFLFKTQSFREFRNLDITHRPALEFN